MIDARALTLPLRFCKQHGCPNKTREGYCPAHKQDNAAKDNDRQRKQNPVNRMYDAARWRGPDGFRQWLLKQNVICQRLTAGVQCTDISTVIHHLVSPRVNPDLFLSPGNCVCLCSTHHPGGEAGTPDWKVGRDFVPTVFRLPNLGG